MAGRSCKKKKVRCIDTTKRFDDGKQLEEEREDNSEGEEEEEQGDDEAAEKDMRLGRMQLRPGFPRYMKTGLMEHCKGKGSGQGKERER